MARKDLLKGLDLFAAALLAIGGLNWGLVGLFGFNLVEAFFGMTVFSRLIYVLVGLAALYDIFGFRAIQRRWECRIWPGVGKQTA
jgi:hypothetical protein